jgi:hypothetical protein
MKRRILWLTFLIVVALLVVPTGSLCGQQEEYDGDTNDLYPLMIQMRQGEKSDISTLLLSETDLNLLTSVIDQVISDMASEKTIYSAITHLLNRGISWNYPLLSLITTLLIRLRMINNHVFIISQGWSYTLNPLRNTTLDLYRLLGVWHYGSGFMFKQSKTVIIRHGYGTWEKEVLLGKQAGIMDNFYGLWLHIPKRLPQKSYTFLVGIARHAVGID